MAAYSLLKDGGVRRNADGLNIPETLDYGPWQEYLVWRQSNTPDPIEPDPPPSQEQLDAIAAKADADVQALAAMTPAQASAYVQANVNNLADAKAFLKRCAVILSVLAKRL